MVTWLSRKQPVVARSSRETYYHSLAEVTSDLLSLQTLLCELKVPHTTPVIFYDNQNTIMLAHNSIIHEITKHMEIDLFFVREKVLAKTPGAIHILGTDQLVDVLTKPLSSSRFLELRSKLHVVNPSTKAHPP